MNSEVQQKAGGNFDLSFEGFKDIDAAAVAAAGLNFAHLADLGVEIRYQHSFNKFFDPVPKARHSVVQVSAYFPVKALEKLAPILGTGFWY